MLSITSRSVAPPKLSLILSFSPSFHFFSSNMLFLSLCQGSYLLSFRECRQFSGRADEYDSGAILVSCQNHFFKFTLSIVKWRLYFNSCLASQPIYQSIYLSTSKSITRSQSLTQWNTYSHEKWSLSMY